MSELQRSFAKAKLAQLPAMAPPSFGSVDEQDEDEAEPSDGQVHDAPEPDHDDSSSASSTSSTATVMPAPSHNLFARAKASSSGATRSNLEPLPWTSCFDQELYLTSTSDSLTIVRHLYLTAPKASGPLFVTHHGAGSSGLSFARLASELRKLLPDSGILSLDARGHGHTVVRPGPAQADAPLDLSLETLSEDLLACLRQTQHRLGWSELPPLLLVGHSLGGAVVTDLAHRGSLADRVLAYAVLDVVEGSAMEALQSMQTYLASRPASFPSVTAGIEWHIRSRTIRNAKSARTSVPPLLTPSPQAPHAWTWRTDLAATQPFWHSWFRGLSSKFLAARGGKLLLLAGTDRLDKELMIGQMQGKYQLQVFPDAGHFIHEDLPEKTAMILADFYRRNDRSALVLPPKVADLLKSKPQANR